jgi:1-acyl-sn-glycerol-3-phosphate acyltransferase
MDFLRALIYSTTMVLVTPFYAVLSVAIFALPYRSRYSVIRQWPRFFVWWLKVVCGVKYEVLGLENMPSRPTIVFSKHSSTWETFFLTTVFRPQVWVLKRELLRVPFFGWGLAMLDPIAIDRSAGRSAMDQVIEQGRERLARGCWVIVFPEGTRIPTGTRQRYKPGGARLAVETGVDVVPVAHNAGDFWPRRKFMKRPGTITVSIGPPLPSAGRTPNQLMAEIEAWIEAEVGRIRSNNPLTAHEPLPLPPADTRRLSDADALPSSSSED